MDKNICFRRKRKKKKGVLCALDYGAGRALKGTVTIEMSYLLPLLFLVILLVVYATFYYHDKNILIGAAAETAVVGAQQSRMVLGKGENDLEVFCKERIKGKMILFSEMSVTVFKTQSQIAVTVCAEKGNMKICTTQRADLSEPEKKIRRKRIVEQLGK